MKTVFTAVFVLMVAVAAEAFCESTPTMPEAKRIKEIAAMLPAEPQGFGPKITDRAAWKKIAAAPQFKDAVSKAEKLMNEPLPELTEELFADFSKTGNRTRAQKVIAIRQQRYPTLVIAECIENKGRFLPAIEKAIRAICSDKTWVLPAHDWKLRNYKGTERDIDLRSSNQGFNLATVDYWLGDRLSDDVRKVMRAKIDEQVFVPFENSVKTGKPRLWWLTHTNNWNAVCLAGVTGTALTLIESPEQRAFYVAAAEKNIVNSTAGYTDDGYCTEGVGYWSYGFGHQMMLGEMIRRATGSKIDLLEDEKVRLIAQFASRMQIVPGVYPPFADCPVGATPDEGLVALVNRRYGFAKSDTGKGEVNQNIGPDIWLFSIGMFSFDDPTMKTVEPKANAPARPLRAWFPETGILICRPGGDGTFGAALKGGNNAEHHNHNDVGSYMIALAGETPLIDPGAEVYTGRTFSNRRYESDVLNSLGHPVPRIDGKLQRTGKSAAARVVASKFTDEQDTLVLDIASAYGVESLKKLHRTFTFTRGDSPGLTVVDTFEFDAPTPLETVLVTGSAWKQVSPGRLLFGEGPSAVEVHIDTAGAEFEIKPSKLTADVIGDFVPVRIAIALKQPAKKGTVTMKIRPAKGE